MCILKYGSLLAPIRNQLTKLKFFKIAFECSLCLGFWSGVIVALLALLSPNGVVPLALPFATAPICWLFDSVMQCIRLKNNLMSKELEES